ncbi:hypothetical protein HOLleu_16702 [Holothuria leucospilota]|uniref:exodeoxyribonuclease III n=1 Tax=Holothuria leucospilota TaxID=206669 RepID=A0A9Q1HB65_HOLLE|nr:hypothetical protein HOLleu_16702 [Holothuria leucospilota]
MRDSRTRSRIFQFCKSLGVDFVLLQETHIVNEDDVHTWSFEWGGGLHASLGLVSSCGTVILISPRWTSLVRKVDSDHEGRLVCVTIKHPHIVNEDDVYTWSYEWGGGLHASFGSSSSCGSVILVSPRWTSLVGKVDHDHEGRVICITIKHPCGNFMLCNVYAPNQPTDRRDFFTTLPSFVPGCAPCILAGDFKCVPDTQFDRMSTCTSWSCGVGMAELDMFTKNHDMVDVWRVQHPGLAVFTWHRPDGTDASRLDRVYSPPALSPSDCEVVACPISDHDAVTVSFQPPESWPAGRGFWKMNTDILTEAEYSKQFKARYEGWRTLRPAFSTGLEWWDDVKSRIKQFTVEYCVVRARRRREEFLSLCSRERNGDSSALRA